MSNNYTFIPSTLAVEAQVREEKELPVFKELAYDFETGQLKTTGGHYFYVEKNEALKVWIYKALKITRSVNYAFSDGYGNEINKLIGSAYGCEILKSELKRLIQEALICNPYIKSLDGWDVSQKGAKVTALFNVNTVYGAIEQNYEYEV